MDEQELQRLLQSNAEKTAVIVRETGKIKDEFERNGLSLNHAQLYQFTKLSIELIEKIIELLEEKQDMIDNFRVATLLTSVFNSSLEKEADDAHID